MEIPWRVAMQFVHINLHRLFATGQDLEEFSFGIPELFQHETLNPPGIILIDFRKIGHAIALVDLPKESVGLDTALFPRLVVGDQIWKQINLGGEVTRDK